MKLAMIGTGYVGLVSGACFAETGNHVICADIDTAKIERLAQGEIPIFEPGLGEMAARNIAEKRLSFSSDVAGAIAESEVVCIAVGTPPRSDGAADLHAVDRVAETVARHVARESVLVIKSTVPVGTNARVRRIVKDAKHRIHVVSNPEFLKEGNAIDDFMKPDRIVIGCDDDFFVRDVMSRLYHPVTLSAERIVWMDPASAELTKYVANTMLAMRISFMNEVAALCEKVGADIHLVRKGVGSDERIGSKFLHAGPGFGGSCLRGSETVLVRHARRTRLVSLERLFRDLAGESDDQARAIELAPGSLQVLAWDSAASRPAMHDVVAVTRRPFEGALLRIGTKMGRRVTCTPDHPFVVVNPETGATTTMLASELTSKDWLPIAMQHADDAQPAAELDLLELAAALGFLDQEVLVRLDSADTARVDGMSHDDIAHALAPLNHPRGRERVYDIRRSHTVRLNEARLLGLSLESPRLGTAKNGTYVPRRIVLDESFWRIAGLYLAEGHRSVDGRRQRLFWSFHPTAEPELVAEIADYFNRIGVRCDVRRGTSTMMVSVSSRLLATAFVEGLGLGGSCYEHRIPELAWNLRPTERAALLSGLWHGDGSWSRVNHGPSVVLEYGTVSRELADGMVRLLAQSGIVARIKTGRSTKSTQDAWFLMVAGADQVERALGLVKPADRDEVFASISKQAKRIAPTGYRRLSDGIAAVRVVDKREKWFQGWVYSLEVAGAHTMVTTLGLVVHNCFPKDVAALATTARDLGVELELASTTDRVNRRQKGVLARKLKHVHFDGDLRGKRIAIWGLAFKPRTDDIRESPALQLIDTLLSEGAEVAAHDPEAMPNVQALYGDRITLVQDAYDAAQGADALVLVTEWRQYQNPDFARLATLMRRPLLLDGRNIWSGYGLRKLGFIYDGIGARGS
jgi:UDPglucose 6-dehydrogenase